MRWMLFHMYGDKQIDFKCVYSTKVDATNKHYQQHYLFIVLVFEQDAHKCKASQPAVVDSK